MDVIFARLRTAIGLVLPVLLTTLPSPSAHSQTITLGPPQTAPVDILMVSDIDFLHTTTPKWLFTISMQSEGTVQATMTITIDVRLADGSHYPSAVFLKTDPFDIMGARVITNIDLTNNNPHVAEYVFDDAASNRLQQTSLSGGRIPAGTYMFTVTVTPADGGTGSTVTFSFEPTNPTTLELFSPADGEEDASEFPLFQWRYDGRMSRLSVYEQLPGQISGEEILSGTPHLTTEVPTNSYQYPSSGVRPLQPGKTYAWVVEGLAAAAGGSDAVQKSEIRTFRITTRNAAWVSGLLDEIEAALGARHKEAFDKIRAQGLFTEGTMSLDGSPITYSELLPLLEFLRSNPEAVALVELE